MSGEPAGAEQEKALKRFPIIWWWPFIVSAFCLLGLFVLYSYSGDIFEFMSPESASKYIFIVATLLISLYIISVLATGVRYLHRRRYKLAAEEKEVTVNE